MKERLTRESGSAAVRAFSEGIRDPSPAAARPRITYREVARSLAAIAEGPRAAVTIGGESVRGEPIWRVAIEPPAEAVADVLIVAGIHAMEHAGVAAALELLRRAGGDDSVWRRHRLVAVPLANPDGFRDTEGDLAAGRRRFRRKNARGVDLNRNFSVHSRGRSFLGRLRRSHGEGPLSEPEARAVDAAAASCAPRYAVSLHAFGNWIFLPYAGARRRPVDFAEHARIAREMASRQPGRGYKVAQVGRVAPLAVRGAEIDHFHETHGARSFLLEIGAGPCPWEPASWLSPYAWFNAPRGRFERDVGRAVAAVEVLADLELGP